MVLVMVGLPARGKTYLAYKLCNYLSWLGYATRVFNVGNYRRSEVGRHMPASFFDPHNVAGVEARRRVAMHALDDLIAWTDAGGNIGIYDATNSTRVRRVLVRRRCEERGLRVLFIESVCNLPDIIEANIRETKLNAPDYRDMTDADAVADFRARIALYETAYEPLDDEDSSHIKLIDVGRRIVANQLQGYLAGRLLNFVMNLHITPRPIWLTRHGESRHNAAGLIGGDAPLSARGEAYARDLRAWVDSECPGELTIWTSTLLRTIQTARPLDRSSLQIRALDEIDAGVCDGMSYERIEAELPEEFAARAHDKLRYRYPRGESYEDVIRRLEPVIIEMERQRDPVLIVAHQAVLRALYGYIQGLPLTDVPRLPIPLHTVIELIPKAYGAEERRIRLNGA
jgi:broad specificity phosphatase PhoE/predicted kinase